MRILRVLISVGSEDIYKPTRFMPHNIFRGLGFRVYCV